MNVQGAKVQEPANFRDFYIAIRIPNALLSGVKFGLEGSERQVVEVIAQAAAGLSGHVIRHAKVYGSAIPAEDVPERSA